MLGYQKLKDSNNEYSEEMEEFLKEYNKCEKQKKLKNSNNEYSKEMEEFLKEYNKCKERKYSNIIDYISYIDTKRKEQLKKNYKEIREESSNQTYYRYLYLINFIEHFKMLYDKDSELFKKNGKTNNEIVDAIFKYIYLDVIINNNLLSELKLSENFFNEIKKYDFKPIEIEFLNAILTKYYPGSKEEIKTWYYQQNIELTYVEKTFLLQIVSSNRGLYIPMNFLNKENSSFEYTLNIHYKSGCYNVLFDSDFFREFFYFVCNTIESDKVFKEQIVYRIFELLSGKEYFTIKKEEGKYKLFKLEKPGTYINSDDFKFSKIVRCDIKYASLFGCIFDIYQGYCCDILKILNAFNNMLNKEEVKDIDKASMLLPLFIENNTINNMLNKKEVKDKDKKTYKTLFDELVDKYNSKDNLKTIFNNIYEKAKEYLPDDYLSKSSYYKQILETKELKNNTVAELSDENGNKNVKTKEGQNNQAILENKEYPDQELESPYSALLNNSSNEDEEIKKESGLKKFFKKIIKYKKNSGSEYMKIE